MRSMDVCLCIFFLDCIVFLKIFQKPPSGDELPPGDMCEFGVFSGIGWVLGKCICGVLVILMDVIGIVSDMDCLSRDFKLMETMYEFKGGFMWGLGISE